MIDLQAAVATIRAHPPTRDVVPQYFICATDDIGDGKLLRETWFHTAPLEQCSRMTPEVARDIIENRLATWHGVARDMNGNVGDYWCESDCVCWGAHDAAKHEHRHFGPDRLAAIMFACGVPMPGDGGGSGDATR